MFRTGLLIDAAAIAVFALLARLAHGGLSLSSWVGTAWPFLVGVLVGWGVVAVVGPRWSLAIVWASAVLVGLVIWAVRHGQAPHWSFIIVATVTSGVLLFAFRKLGGKLQKV